MKTCARCGTAGAGLKCPSCGMLLVTAPAAVARIGAVPATAAADAPTPDEQFFAPATVTMIVRPPGAPPTRRSPATTAIIVLLVAVGAFGAYQLVGTVSGTSKPKAPVVLSAHGPAQGLPGGLEDAVRIQAESARQHALAVVVQARGENIDLAPAALSNLDPALKWVAGDVSSTAATQVSILVAADGAVTVAISAASKTICAYAELPAAGVAQYVTLGNVSSCRAADAPQTGWSGERGGSASDPPPDGY